MSARNSHAAKAARRKQRQHEAFGLSMTRPTILAEQPKSGKHKPRPNTPKEQR